MNGGSNLKSSYFKTNGNFFALLVYTDSDTREKTIVGIPLNKKKDFDRGLNERIETRIFGGK